MDQYKAKLLSFIEYRTPAIYHATSSVLAPLDRLQTTFLRQACISEMEALMVFNLAPLRTRRDIAMMGVIHRTALGKGPPQLARFFSLDRFGAQRVRTRAQSRQHTNHLAEYRQGAFLEILGRSALGLICVYNALPDRLVAVGSVSEFQASLQAIVKERAAAGCEDWADTFSTRIAMTGHPVLNV